MTSKRLLTSMSRTSASKSKEFCAGDCDPGARRSDPPGFRPEGIGVQTDARWHHTEPGRRLEQDPIGLRRPRICRFEARGQWCKIQERYFGWGWRQAGDMRRPIGQRSRTHSATILGFIISGPIDMNRFIVSFAALLSIAFGSPAAAQLEILAPETAREQVGASQGVVVVDLYAEW